MCMHSYNYMRKNNKSNCASIRWNIEVCGVLTSDRSYWLSLSIAKVLARRSLPSHLPCVNTNAFAVVVELQLKSFSWTDRAIWCLWLLLMLSNYVACGEMLNWIVPTNPHVKRRTLKMLSIFRWNTWLSGFSICLLRHETVNLTEMCPHSFSKLRLLYNLRDVQHTLFWRFHSWWGQIWKRWLSFYKLANYTCLQ